MRNPFIFKVLDVSTGHMRLSDNAALALDVGQDRACAYELRDCGWLCYVGEWRENWDGYSVDFLRIMEQAAEAGAEYVRFDRDGKEYPDLPTYNW